MRQNLTTSPRSNARIKNPYEVFESVKDQHQNLRELLKKHGIAVSDLAFKV
jgi:N-dimethylarginine dimethylaminohydrolase